MKIGYIGLGALGGSSLADFSKATRWRWSSYEDDENAMNAGCRLGTLEAAGLGRKADLSLRAMSEFLSRGNARNRTTEKMLPALIEGRPSTNCGLALMLKDVNQAVSLDKAQGVPMPVTNVVRGLMQIGLNTVGQSAQLEDTVARWAWSPLKHTRRPNPCL